MIYYNVKVTQIAEQDYYKAEAYIKYELYNQKAAAGLAKKLHEAINDLSFFPTKYPICNDDFLRVWEIIIVPVNNYLLFYIVREDEKIVYVLRFLYSRRNWQKILRKHLEDEIFDLTTHYIQEETEKYGAK